jgi:hypothetical protein
MAISTIAFLLFAAFSGLRIFSYLPQIYRVAHDPNGASAISYATWGLWTGSNLATALYAYANLRDVYLAGVSTVYAICCVAVIVLTIAKRRRSAARSQAAAQTRRFDERNRIEMPARSS